MDYEQQLINTLTLLNAKVSEGDAEQAHKLQAKLDDDLIKWCESEYPPSQAQLETIQQRITDIVKSAETARNVTQKNLLEQRKSSQAISKYKSAKP